MKQLFHALYRILFAASFLLSGVYIFEKIVNLSGYTLLRGFSPWRLLELAAVALLFVIAIQLREIKIFSDSRGPK